MNTRARNWQCACKPGVLGPPTSPLPPRLLAILETSIKGPPISWSITEDLDECCVGISWPENTTTRRQPALILPPALLSACSSLPGRPTKWTFYFKNHEYHCSITWPAQNTAVPAQPDIAPTCSSPSTRSPHHPNQSPDASPTFSTPGPACSSPDLSCSTPVSVPACSSPEPADFSTESGYQSPSTSLASSPPPVRLNLSEKLSKDTQTSIFSTSISTQSPTCLTEFKEISIQTTPTESDANSSKPKQSQHSQGCQYELNDLTSSQSIEPNLPSPPHQEPAKTKKKKRKKPTVEAAPPSGQPKSVRFHDYTTSEIAVQTDPEPPTNEELLRLKSQSACPSCFETIITHSQTPQSHYIACDSQPGTAEELLDVFMEKWLPHFEINNELILAIIQASWYSPNADTDLANYAMDLPPTLLPYSKRNLINDLVKDLSTLSTDLVKAYNDFVPYGGDFDCDDFNVDVSPYGSDLDIGEGYGSC